MQQIKGNMDCHSFRNNLFSYVEKQLMESDQRAFEEHRTGCAECAMIESGFRSVEALIAEKKATPPLHIARPGSSAEFQRKLTTRPPPFRFFSAGPFSPSSFPASFCLL